MLRIKLLLILFSHKLKMLVLEQHRLILAWSMMAQY